MTKLDTKRGKNKEQYLPADWIRAASSALERIPPPRPQVEVAKRLGREFWQAGGGGGDKEFAAEILNAWWSEENTYPGFWLDVLNVPDRTVKGFQLFHRARMTPPWVIEEVQR